MQNEQSVPYLSLSTQPDVESAWVEFFARRGVRFAAHRPVDLESTNATSTRGHYAFALAHVPNPNAPEIAFTQLGVHHVSFVPLVLIVDRPLDPDQRERLRLLGATSIIERTVTPADESTVRELVSAHWFTANLERAPVADLLQMMAASKQSGMVNVACPHMRPLVVEPWSKRRPFACGVAGADACNGWNGRLYVQQGELVHAETPTKTGIEAMSQMLALTNGTIRILDVFVAPKETTLSGRIENILLNAAIALDHADLDGAPIAEPAADPRPETPLFAPVPQQTKSEDILGEIAHDDFMPAAPLVASTNGSNDPSGLGGAVPSLRLMLRSDREGQLIGTDGDGTEEGLCAASAMSTRTMDRVAEEMGIGGIRGWSATNRKNDAIYVVVEDEQLVVLYGGATKNPLATMNQISKALNAK